MQLTGYCEVDGQIVTCVQGQTSVEERTAMALAFLRVAQTLLQEVKQSLSRGDTAMDLDEDEEQAMVPLSSQAGALPVVRISLKHDHACTYGEACEASRVFSRRDALSDAW